MDDMEQVGKIVSACQGNPGAARVIGEMLSVGESLHGSRSAAYDDVAECIEAAGLRGPLLWVAYKYVCGQDVGRLWARMHSDREALAREAFEAKEAR